MDVLHQGNNRNTLIIQIVSCMDLALISGGASIPLLSSFSINNSFHAVETIGPRGDTNLIIS